jgi:kynureninase
MTSLGLERYREAFPVLAERVYFACQCMGPFPREGYRDLEEYVQARSLHNRTLGAWLERFEEVTRLVETLLGAPAGSVALRDSATACQAAIASAVEPTGKRNRIIVTALDFHSSLHLWQAQSRRGFEIVEVPPEDGMSISAAALAREIDERTAIVAVSLVSRNSALLDAAPVIARAREVGAISIIDAYQAAGVVPFNVDALGADVVVAGTHKWLSGETGLAFMYVRPDLADRLEPAYPGWFANAELHSFVHAHTFVDRFVPFAGARRFQQGTPAMASIYGARAGLRFVLEAGVDRIRECNSTLTTKLYDGALALGVTVLTPRPASERAGGICLQVADPEAFVDARAARGVDVDQRRRMLVRVAPHACSTLEDCDRFLELLGELHATRRS